MGSQGPCICGRDQVRPVDSHEAIFRNRVKCSLHTYCVRVWRCQCRHSSPMTKRNVLQTSCLVQYVVGEALLSPSCCCQACIAVKLACHCHKASVGISMGHPKSADRKVAVCVVYGVLGIGWHSLAPACRWCKQGLGSSSCTDRPLWASRGHVLGSRSHLPHDCQHRPDHASHRTVSGALV